MIETHHQSYKRPRRPDWDKRPRHFDLRDHSFVVLWLAALLLVFVLGSASPVGNQGQTIRGMVEAETVSVGAVETARLMKLFVKPGQAVQAGDVLGELDTALIEGGVTADLIDIVSIRSSFGDTHQDVIQAISQRRDAMAAIESDIAYCRQEWEREKAELAGLQAEQKRRETQRAKGYIDDIVAAEYSPMIAALEKAVAAYPARMKAYEQQLEEARTFYQHIMNWLGAKDDENISQAISRRNDEENIMKLLDKGAADALKVKDAYTLRATADGVVSATLYREGDTVPAGMPVIRLVTPTPRLITAYLSELQANTLAPGDRVTVRSTFRPGTPTATAECLSVAAELRLASYELNMTGDPAPVRNQCAQLTFTGPHEFVGGEVVYLQVARPNLIARLWRKLRGNPT